MKVYKYDEYFGRMGSLQSVFVASDKDIAALRKMQHIYLGECLGKHSEITATVDDKTLRELTDDSAVIAFLTDHLDGCIGTDLLGHMRDQDDEAGDD